MRASYNGHKEVVKLLLDHGADMNMQDKVSVTDMIYMRDVYVMYVCVCVYECMINFIYVCLFNGYYVYLHHCYHGDHYFDFQYHMYCILGWSPGINICIN